MSCYPAPLHRGAQMGTRASTYLITHLCAHTTVSTDVFNLSGYRSLRLFYNFMLIYGQPILRFAANKIPYLLLDLHIKTINA